MAVQGVYYGLDLATVTQIRTETLTAIEAILKTGASYSIGGRQLTRANLQELQNTVMECTAAINRLSGPRARINRTFPDYSRGGRN
jgi:hypothetical protein